MRHPTEGVLRRLVDEPGGVADADRTHVAVCSVCQATLDLVLADAAATRAALHPGDLAGLDVGAAWHRLSAAQPQPVPPQPARPAPVRSRRWPAVLRSPLAAAVGAAVVLSGAGVAAAADWLPIFRTERVAPVPVATVDLVHVPDLSAYGDVELTGDGGPRLVPDATAARQATGLIPPQVAQLPRGVRGEPAYQVGDRVTGTFTFRSAKAAAAAAGQPLPPPPPGLDGSRLRLTAGPGVAEVWKGAGELPTLVVARAVAPLVESSGVPYATVRDYLLSLPGLPQDVADQLRNVSADGTTLPVLVPADRATSSTADVHGRRATVLTARDRSFAGVVWVDGGTVTGVAGAVGADEVLAVARGLR